MPVPAQITLSDAPKKAEKIYNFNHGKLIDLTPEAVAKVKEFAAQNADQTAGKNFRIAVEGGGCSGMQYKFTFDTKKDDDNLVPCGDIAVLVDAPSLTYMKDAVVDYVNDFSGAGFVVKNPLSKGECGCGISFAV